MTQKEYAAFIQHPIQISGHLGCAANALFESVRVGFKCKMSRARTHHSSRRM